MHSEDREYRPSGVIIAYGLLSLFFGVGFLWIGAVQGGSEAGGGTRTHYIATNPDLACSSFGLFWILAAGLLLLWCARGRLIFNKDGLAVRNLFGKIVRQVAWGEITGLESGTVRDIQKYWVKTANGSSIYLSGYKGIESLPDELAQRVPNLRVAKRDWGREDLP